MCHLCVTSRESVEVCKGLCVLSGIEGEMPRTCTCACMRARMCVGVCARAHVCADPRVCVRGRACGHVRGRVRLRGHVCAHVRLRGRACEGVCEAFPFVLIGISGFWIIILNNL